MAGLSGPFLVVPNAVLVFLLCFAPLLSDTLTFTVGEDLCRFNQRKIVSRIFEGLRHTHPSVVRRELHQREGDLFTCRLWEKEKLALQDLDIFARVELGIEEQDGGLALTYGFSELPPYIPVLVVHKTDQDGFSAGPGLASLNLLGRDIRMELYTRFGGTTEYQWSLNSPHLGPWPLEYDFFVRRVDAFNPFLGANELSHDVRLDLFWWWDRLALAGRAELFGFSSSNSSLMLDPTSSSDWVPTLGTGLIYDARDRRYNPRAGWYGEFRAEKAGGSLGGDADYWAFLGDSRFYFPWGDRHVTQLSGLYRWKSGVEGQNIGSYELFHAGGINSLRGHEPNSMRGIKEVSLNWEHRWQFTEPMHFKVIRWPVYFALEAVAGIDRVQMWRDSKLLDGSGLVGCYTGLHFLVPGIEKIRMEWGIPSDRWAVRFETGIFEKAKIQRFRKR